MKKSRLIQVVCAATITGALAFGMVGCGSNNSSGLTGGVAATVNGAEIAEDTVTTYIQNFRETSNYMKEEDWGKWLAENKMTPETVREQVVSYYAGQELIKKAAEENGVSVDSAAVESTISSTKANYDSDEAWKQVLEDAGMTEAAYRESVESGLLEQQLSEKVAKPEAATDEELMQYAKMYASAYNGARRSSQILFASGDDATAQSTLDKINAGELDFATAAKELSKDSGSAANGGDVGWDLLNNFVDPYEEALKGLEAGQVSGLVKSDYGIHIIKCTEVFAAPEEVTSLDQIPEAFLTKIKASLDSSKKSTAFSTWYSDYKSKATIDIKPMPAKVPYNLDMSKYPAPAAGTATDGANAPAPQAENTGNAESAPADQNATAPAAEKAPDAAN
ncbi:MAG: SurA N-terminal domain-containing protein [Raoultibacter sp.]